MTCALVVLEKAIAGEVWSNVWAIGTQNVSGGFSGEPTVDDLQAWGINAGFLDANTVNVAGGYATILQAIINFERRLHFAEVGFTRIYLTDGKKNFNAAGEPQTNIYFTETLAFPGLLTNPAAGSVLSGLVSLMIAKNPVGFSSRRGRAFLRLCLADGEVKAEASGLVDWESDTAKTGVLARVAAAVTGSGLDRHFLPDGNAVAGGVLIVPHFTRYVPATTSVPAIGGELADGAGVRSVVGVRPAGRQVRRGRKRKVA